VQFDLGDVRVKGLDHFEGLFRLWSMAGARSPDGHTKLTL
jgi:hypothetical protein